MNRKSGLILSIIFLCVQVLALLHMAAYGFEEHEHKGHVCCIYLCVEQSKFSAATGDAISEHRLDFIHCFISFGTQPYIPFQNYTPSDPRAPPVFLLS